jgi:hypothetical protein
MDRARPYTSTGEDASSAPYGIGVVELQGQVGGLAAAGSAAKSRCTETMEKAGRRPGEDLSPESRSPLETAAPERHPTPATAVGDERGQQGELRRLRTSGTRRSLDTSLMGRPHRPPPRAPRRVWCRPSSASLSKKRRRRVGDVAGRSGHGCWVWASWVNRPEERNGLKKWRAALP